MNTSSNDDERARPRFSIITAVYNPPLKAFADTVASVLGQDYDDWEWILVDDRSPDSAVRERLREVAASDPRIQAHERETNGGIVAASSDALARARGEFVVLLDHDDVLVTHALSTVSSVIDEEPEFDYSYSDQDYMTSRGRIHSPYYKPDFSPERLRHHMFCSHLSVLRRSLVEEVGGFRAGYDGSQDHDLVLRVTERARVIRHIEHVLYHWREVPGSAADDPEAKPWAWDAGVRAVQSHLDRVGIDAVATKGTIPGLYKVTRTPDPDTSVSVIIPTIGSTGTVRGERRVMVTETIRSLLAKTEHRALELIVVFDTPTPATVLDELRRIACEGVNLRLVEFTEPFNFSAKCNVGAAYASGDVLLFLNDDMEAITDGLVEQLIAPLSEPDVGATGPKLLFEGSRIQHAGVSYGSGTIAHQYYKQSHPAATGYYGELWMNREVSVLTGACIAVRREVFDDVGGFYEGLPVNFNDVDFCQKVRSRGLRLVWQHDVMLYHFESISRSTHVHDWEKKVVNERWGDYHDVRERLTNGVR